MKMRKFADEGIVREGKNKNIDDDTRATAMASVPPLSDLDTGAKPVAAPSKGGPVAVPGMGGPVAAGTLTKPAIVTLQQLNAFKAKYGADKDLTDYMNAQAGGLKRRNTFDPVLRNREADAAFARERIKAVAKPTADEIANQQRKEKLNRLKIASAGAESKMRQANASSMSRADFVKGYASGGAVSASRRGDGIAQRGKTRGRMC